MDVHWTGSVGIHSPRGTGVSHTVAGLCVLTWGGWLVQTDNYISWRQQSL